MNNSVNRRPTHTFRALTACCFHFLLSAYFSTVDPSVILFLALRTCRDLEPLAGIHRVINTRQPPAPRAWGLPGIQPSVGGHLAREAHARPLGLSCVLGTWKNQFRGQVPYIAPEDILKVSTFHMNARRVDAHGKPSEYCDVRLRRSAHDHRSSSPPGRSAVSRSIAF